MDNEDQDQGAVVNSGFKETLLLLPEEVRFCLEITGYDNEHSLSSLTDVNEIEVFLIEHAKIIKQVEPRKSIKAYGIFYNFCEEFKFKPGHKKMLEELIADLIKKKYIQTSFSNLDVLLDKPDNVWRPTHELGKDTDTETLTTEINLPEGSPAVAQEVSLTDNINSKEEERKLSEKIEENTKVSQDFERNEQVIDVIDQPITKSQTISKKDQWSPLNPEGKRQYDRSFLLQMQFQTLSLRKPEGLPDLEVIKDSVTDWSNKTKPVSLAGFQRSHTPGYVKSCAKPRDAQVKCQSIIEERLMGVIDLVFEKALDEPNFSIAYTNLCQRLRMKKIPTGNQDNHFVKFREFLLKKCQKEFEGDSPADITKVKRDNEMFTDDKAMKDELAEESDEELQDLERKAKTRSLGNIRFIGELFELHMLTASIMCDCLKKLLNYEDEESFEVLSTMLTIIGENIDPEKSKSNNNEPRRGINRNSLSPSRDSSKGRGIQMAPPDQHRSKAVVHGREKKKQLPLVTESRHAARGSSRESSTTSEEKKDVVLRGNPDLTEKEIERRAKALIDEFLHISDFQEAILCVSEIFASTTISFFVTHAFNCVLERSPKIRQQVGQLMHDLIKAKVMTPEQYIKGLQAILSLVKDYAIDIPHIWEYLGELIAPLIEDSTLPLICLHEVAQPCYETGCAGYFVTAVLHAVSKKLGTHEVGELWRSWNLQWSQFLLSSVKTEEFIKENKLEFTVKPPEPCKTTNFSSGQLKTELTALFANKQTEIEEIFDWIDAHLNESQCHEASFVRALMIAVCQSVLGKSNDSTIQVDEALLRNRCNILRKYLDHSEACEMQALYALQALMHQLEQPKGILCTFFGFLYDEEIISEDTFLLWKMSEDPVEQEGKSVALNSVRSFYGWLEEAENESVEENELDADIQSMYPNQQMRLAEHQQRTSANTNTHDMGKQCQSGKPGASNTPMVFGTHMPPNLQPFYSRQPPPRPQVSSVNQRPGINMGINPATATQQQQSLYAHTQQPPPQQINTMQHMTGGGTPNYRIQYPPQQPYQVQSPAQTMYVSTANTPFTHYGGGNPPVFYSHMMPRHPVPSMPPSQQPQLPKREKKLIRIQDPTTSGDLTEEIVGHKIDNSDSDLYKRFGGILNELTPEKFNTLSKQVNDLSIDTEERLMGVTNLVFEKALDEPNFSVADLCKCLAMKKVPTGNQDNHFVYQYFRKLLLNKCQKEFERDTADDVARIKRAKEMFPDDEAKKRELDEELEDLERKAKRRSLGNIRFIGELFKLHMLTASIIHDCLKKLLNQEDDHSLECFCILLTTIGKDIDPEKSQSNNKEPVDDKMNSYFRMMKEIINKRQASPRVRFMLQDVTDLRQNNWVPRRDENNPKTLDQS